MIETLEKIVTKQCNPTVHQLHFRSVHQLQEESIKDFVVRLRSSAPDCEFQCPSCHFDLQSINIKDQFIRGLQNESIQIDRKASQLKTLEDVVKHSEAFETAQCDQIQLQGSSEVMAARMSDYQKKKKEPNLPKPQTTRPCSGCGSHSHGQPGSNDRSTKFPAWVKNCLNCKIPNHVAQVCQQQSQSDSAQALIASVEYDQDSDTFTTATTLTSIEEIPAIISPSLPRHQHINPVKMNIFPDGGSSICLAGPQHIAKFNLDTHDLIPCYKQVKEVG